MTTPLRLPDPFTPGTTQATAATPTCSCCCCCCCVVSAVSTSVALPAGFLRDLDKQRAPQDTFLAPERRIAATIALALVPACMIGALLFLADEIKFPAVALIPWSVAALTVVVVSMLGGSRSPFSGPLRLLVGTAAGLAEMIVAWPLLAAGPLGTAIYGAAILAIPWLLLRHYRRRRAR